MSFRRALLWSTGDRYVAMVTSFLAVAVVSRLLSPAEIGLMAVGMAVSNLIEILRDSGATAIIIQAKTTADDVPRSAFTMMALQTLGLALPLLAFAAPLATVYGDDRLAPLLRVLALGTLPAPFFVIPFAVLRREMAFSVPAAINILNAATVAIVTITFAAAGGSFMSAAAGILAGNTLAAVALVAARRDLAWVFRPTLARIGATWRLGGASALAGVLLGLHEFIPNIYLGRVLGLSALGQYNRAFTVYAVPDRLILTGLAPVVLPKFSALARDGHDVRDAYLRGLAFLSVVKWPVHIMFAALAEPIIALLLGPQWSDVVPFVRLFSVAALVNFALSMTYPVLVASDAVRLYLWVVMASVPCSLAIMGVATGYGLAALVWSALPSIAVMTLPGMVAVCRLIGIGWRDVAGAVRKSAIVTAISVGVPVAIVVGIEHVSMVQAVGLAILAAAGWMIGLRLTRHPLLGELHRWLDAGLKVDARRLVPRWLRRPIRALLARGAGRAGRSRD